MALRRQLSSTHVTFAGQAFPAPASLLSFEQRTRTLARGCMLPRDPATMCVSPSSVDRPRDAIRTTPRRPTVDLAPTSQLHATSYAHPMDHPMTTPFNLRAALYDIVQPLLKSSTEDSATVQHGVVGSPSTRLQVPRNLELEFDDVTPIRRSRRSPASQLRATLRR
jgi:hypothetical protein